MKELNIACLPVAGIKNPYQYLMIKGLNECERINAFNGVDDRFFGIFRTLLKYKLSYIHFDWIQNYYIRRRLWMTLILLPVFLFQLLYIRVFTKTKIVWTLHNIMPHNAEHLLFNKWVRHFFAKQCKWIRVFSEDSIQKASKELNIPINKFIVVPEGDYTFFYENNITQKQARQQLKINDLKKVFLYLGFIKPYKGLEKLIKEFSKLEDKEICLIIAGEGINKKYTELLKRQICELNDQRIKLTATFIPLNDLQTYYNAADLVVLPFDKVENSGSAIMAMGFKKPIIAPKMGALKNRLKQQDLLLYDFLDNGLKNALQLEKNDLEELGKQNFLALQNNNWEDYTKYF